MNKKQLNIHQQFSHGPRFTCSTNYFIRLIDELTATRSH